MVRALNLSLASQSVELRDLEVVPLGDGAGILIRRRGGPASSLGKTMLLGQRRNHGSNPGRKTIFRPITERIEL